MGLGEVRDCHCRMGIIAMFTVFIQAQDSRKLL